MNLGRRSFFVFGVLFAAAIAIRSTTALPPCNSRLRFLFPKWFKHCDCSYSAWSEWEPVPNTVGQDMSDTCESGQAFNETRRKIALGEGCEGIAENRTICAPTQMVRLILLLGLGTKSTPLNPDKDRNVPTSTEPIATPTQAPLRSKRTDTLCESEPLCKNLWQGKRSTQENKMKDSSRLESSEIKHNAPIPFSVSEHGHRFRRNINKCDPNDVQHVLFVLDTSGSIGVERFNQMTNTVADLTTLFCKPIEVAVLTYSHQLYIEFCFNCFGTDEWSRNIAADTIRNITYRGGGTATGGAAKCVCETLLDSRCGVETMVDNTCVDVIFITDGHSNDHNLEICDEVSCLHHHNLKLNTYSIGIGNYNKKEIECIQDNSNSASLFTFESFQDFSDEIDEVALGLLSSSEHTCTDTEGTLHHETTNPTG